MQAMFKLGLAQAFGLPAIGIEKAMETGEQPRASHTPRALLCCDRGGKFAACTCCVCAHVCVCWWDAGGGALFTDSYAGREIFFMLGQRSKACGWLVVSVHGVVRA